MKSEGVFETASSDTWIIEFFFLVSCLLWETSCSRHHLKERDNHHPDFSLDFVLHFLIHYVLYFLSEIVQLFLESVQVFCSFRSLNFPSLFGVFFVHSLCHVYFLCRFSWKESVLECDSYPCSSLNSLFPFFLPGCGSTCFTFFIFWMEVGETTKKMMQWKSSSHSLVKQIVYDALFSRHILWCLSFSHFLASFLRERCFSIHSKKGIHKMYHAVVFDLESNSFFLLSCRRQRGSLFDGKVLSKIMEFFNNMIRNEGWTDKPRGNMSRGTPAEATNKTLKLMSS